MLVNYLSMASEMHCCLGTCSHKQIIKEEDSRIEVQASVPNGGLKKLWAQFLIEWNSSGQAMFHPDCWKSLLTSARARNKKRSKFPKMSQSEKSMILEAAKSQERHDSQKIIKAEAKRIADLIQSSKHCVCFTGAGLSTAAGIGDYRGKSGKWTEMDREKSHAADADDSEPATKKRKTNEDAECTADASLDGEAEEEDVDGVAYEKLRPTYSHEALVKLMDDAHLKYCISQNGDGLHMLSGIPAEKISELHGNVYVELCEKCGHRYTRDYYVLDDEASQYHEEMEECGESVIKKPLHAKQCDTCKLSHRTGRTCTLSNNNDNKVCGGHLKDTIINFGDMLEAAILDRAEVHAGKCDVMLCLGSTITVTPACELVVIPPTLVICNRQKTALDSAAVKSGSRVFGDCDRVMREVMACIYPPQELATWEARRQQRMQQYNKQRQEDIPTHKMLGWNQIV